MSGTQDNQKSAEVEAQRPVDRLVMLPCPTCNGRKEIDRIVDHDDDYCAVWATEECWKCEGAGEVEVKV